MTYFLFLDDERAPNSSPMYNPDIPCIAVRNEDEFFHALEKYGVPSYISFDNDLGPGETEGYDIMKRLVELDIDGVIDLTDTEFHIHSMNPIAAKNMENYIRNYMKVQHEMFINVGLGLMDNSDRKDMVSFNQLGGNVWEV